MSSITIDDILYLRENSGTHEYSFDNSSWSTLSWPITLDVGPDASGGFDVIYRYVYFTTDMNLTSTSNYFICTAGGIQFGNATLGSSGARPTILIDGVSNYPGLIRNGLSSTNGQNYIRIVNLVVNSSASTLAGGNGWFCQEYFARGATNNVIINCSSNGTISASSGGIVGSYAGNNTGSSSTDGITAYQCNSTGAISGDGGGGIFGRGAGSSGYAMASQCFSTGTITGTGSGGIFGRECGNSSGYVEATACYFTGAISGSDSGGIFGASGGTGGEALAENCYTSGSMSSGTFSGGIFGAQAAFGSSGTATASNCYSTGAINASAGSGIFGFNHGTVNTNAIAINCYSSGASGSTARGIYASSPNQLTEELGDNYSESRRSTSGWNSTNANTVLVGIPSTGNVGSKWVSPASNQPYEIRSMGFSPYSLTCVVNSSLNESTTQTINVSSSGTAAVFGSSFSIVGINDALPSTVSTITINSSSGIVSVASGTSAGTYTLIIRNVGIGSGYSYSSMTITSASVPSPPTSLSAVAGITDITVYFTAGDDGDSAITNYQYSLNDGATFTALSPADDSSPITISPVISNTSYVIRLKAVNEVGASSQSDSITILTLRAPTPLISLDNLKYLDASVISETRMGNTILAGQLRDRSGKNKFSSYSDYIKYRATRKSKKTN